MKAYGPEHTLTMNAKLKATSEYAFKRLSEIRGIQPTKATAAIYMMVKIDPNEFKDIEDEVEFAKKIAWE